MAGTLQHERTWEVSDAFVLPNIEGVVADAELHRESTESVASYYDTVDLDLVATESRCAVTMRRHVPMAVGDAHQCAKHRTDVEVVGASACRTHQTPDGGDVGQGTG